METLSMTMNSIKNTLEKSNFTFIMKFYHFKVAKHALRDLIRTENFPYITSCLLFS